MKTRVIIIIAAICLSWTMDASAQKSKEQVVRDYIDILNTMFETKQYEPAAAKLEPIMLEPKQIRRNNNVITIGCRIDDFISKEIMNEKGYKDLESLKPETYLLHLWNKCREKKLRIDIKKITANDKIVLATLTYSGYYNYPKEIAVRFYFFDATFICAINQDWDLDKLQQLQQGVEVASSSTTQSPQQTTKTTQQTTKPTQQTSQPTKPTNQQTSAAPNTTSSERMVKGKVVDKSGEPLPGVNVVQRGTTNGTITDLDGYFTIYVPSDAGLVFSYIGFDSQTVNVNGSTSLPTIVMKENVRDRFSPGLDFATDNLLYSGIGHLLKSRILRIPNRLRRWIPSTTYRPTVVRQFYFGDEKAKTYPDLGGELLGLSHWSLKNYSLGGAFYIPIRSRINYRMSLAYDQEGYEIEPIGGEKQWIIKRQLVPSILLSRNICSWRWCAYAGISYHKPFHYHDNVIDDKNAVNSGLSFSWGVTYKGFGFRMCHSLYNFYNKDFTMADGSKPFADTRSKIVRMEIDYHF